MGEKPAPSSGLTATLDELLDLSISSHEPGTVNFNILRVLLADLIKKISKVDKTPVKLGEHEANHVSVINKRIVVQKPI
jgi:hypothetical protein